MRASFLRGRWALIASLLLAPLLGHGQYRPTVTTGRTAVLTGRVSAPTADSVAVSLRDNPFDPQEKLFRAALNSKGEFRLSVPVAGGTKADLVYDDDVAPLFLDPGTDLDVRFKGEDMAATLHFKANDVPMGPATWLRGMTSFTPEQRHRLQAANANNYLVEADAQFIENDGFQVLPDNIQLYEKPFLSFLDYRRLHELEFLDDHAFKSAFTPEFYKYAKAEIIYSYANDRLTFPDLREQVVNTEARLNLSPTYFDFLHDPTLINDPNAVQSELYHDFLLNYVHFAAKRPRTDPEYYTASYAIARRQVIGASKLLALGRVMQESFRFGHVKQSDAMLADFQSLDTKNQYYSTLKADFDRYKNFAIGAPAPDFKLPTATGDTVSLHDFQGKLVYLNFWKTTNGLALRDMTYAQELMRKLDGRNIAFINISLDDNEAAWHQLVAAQKLPGVQLRLAGGLHTTLAQAYALQELPTYMLIGEDGTFLNTKPHRLSSRAAFDEISQSFGKANTYSGALTIPGSR